MTKSQQPTTKNSRGEFWQIVVLVLNFATVCLLIHPVNMYEEGAGDFRIAIPLGVLRQKQAESL
jgi:hypothetical protein